MARFLLRLGGRLVGSALGVLWGSRGRATTAYGYALGCVLLRLVLCVYEMFG